jgi:hypothetical protein
MLSKLRFYDERNDLGFTLNSGNEGSPDQNNPITLLISPTN